MKKTLFLAFLFLTACVAVPVEPVPDDNPLPPKGEVTDVQWPAGLEQCQVQPEIYICQQECLSERASTRYWCQEGYVFNPDEFNPRGIND